MAAPIAGDLGGVLLGKGKGQGVMDQRVIGLLPPVGRAWSRVRRITLEERIHEHASSRPCVWGHGPGRSAPLAVAHSALEAEAATANGCAYAEAMIDLKQAYECILHNSLGVALVSGP